MFLRDEHKAQGSVTNRLKRKITTHAPVNPPPRSVPENPSYSGLPNQMEVDQQIRVEIEDDEEINIDPVLSSQRSLRMIAIEMAEQARHDGEEEEEEESTNHQTNSSRPSGPPPTTRRVTTPEKRSLADLFNFEDKYWQEQLKRATMLSLSAEMELHELLDIDAEGEVDTEMYEDL